MKARIKRLDPSVDLPKYHSSEAAAFDLSANAGAMIDPGEVVKVPTGLIIEAPEGHFLLIAGRSSLSKKGLKLANGVGVVDRDYAGPEDECLIILHNFSSQPIQISKGDRLAQGIFLPVDQVQWEEVEAIRETSRGGWGSTGGYSN